MGRTLRKVPADWQHPKKDNGEWQPQFAEYYGDALAEWLENHDKWANGSHPDLTGRPELKDKYPFYAMWGGNPPDVDYYRTVKYSDDLLTHIQLYEDTTEGTPLTPVYPVDQLEQLCEYAAEHATIFGDAKQTKERWLEMLKSGNTWYTVNNNTFI